MSTVRWLAAAAIVGLSCIGGTEPGAADAIYPWCARARVSEVGVPSCGFSSQAQCMASFAGSFGACIENPAYRGSPPAPGNGRRKPLVR